MKGDGYGFYIILMLGGFLGFALMVENVFEEFIEWTIRLSHNFDGF